MDTKTKNSIIDQLKSIIYSTSSNCSEAEIERFVMILEKIRKAKSQKSISKYIEKIYHFFKED